MKDLEQLINFWNYHEFTDKPFVHPQDGQLIHRDYCYSFTNLENYFSTNDYWENQGLFHTDLFPIPYIGSLSSAKIFILLLNPGFAIPEYYAESSSIEFGEELRRNLSQENLDPDFPFFFLNPKFLWHPGGQYWLRKLKDYIIELNLSKEMPFVECLSYLSKRIAVLELAPYHSNGFRQNNLTKKLPSAMLMKTFVNKFLVPKTTADECCIICTRKAKEWNLEKSDNIVIYEGSDTRGAHLSKNTRAYPAITHFLQH